ncbi:serine/threonine-protein kinase [Polyangium sorediatum]|uniref:Serine/threonine-protein kinase n=1 Tax=Polyangium sorediatum TaxID=889274 RepID=A0ABT6NQI5_9BACT|nr:serine/threonine-protein kinase [Polyangium sorediatum]MDI1430430.1 serine/threonine-protein kinase [Polyangium sorediatum]
MTLLESMNAETLLAPGDDGFARAKTAMAPGKLLSSLPPPPSVLRTTVLPRVEGDGAEVRLVPESKSRYEPIKTLGAGGMGEVVLVHDQDIARKVAVKRLLPEASDPGMLARFVDEIRTVGRLEHPNIVPIHDVGVDELGRYFFVMKYVEGETLETIIRKLADGDPESHAKYTFERRVEIFIDVLQALAYAHANGVVHRDVKPANVMVGRYGEVVLMDWGIAKPIAAERDLARGADATLGDETERGRMFLTHVGMLVGTPAYMSPEQARGDVDQLDTRSDLYSACVLFHELVTLRHYLADKQTLGDILTGVMEHELTVRDMKRHGHPAQEGLPPELVHFAVDGLAKDPAKRYPSAGQMIELLRQTLEGRIHVACSGTLAKRFLREAARGVDRHPRLMFWGLVGTFVAVVFAFAQLVRMIVA